MKLLNIFAPVLAIAISFVTTSVRAVEQNYFERVVEAYDIPLIQTGLRGEDFLVYYRVMRVGQNVTVSRDGDSPRAYRKGDYYFSVPDGFPLTGTDEAIGWIHQNDIEDHFVEEVHLDILAI